MVAFIASVLDLKHFLWANLIQKMKIASFSGNFEIWSNSKTKNSVVILTRSIFERKYPFYDKSVSKLFVEAEV